MASKDASGCVYKAVPVMMETMKSNYVCIISGLE